MSEQSEYLAVSDRNDVAQPEYIVVSGDFRWGRSNNLMGACLHCFLPMKPTKALHYVTAVEHDLQYGNPVDFDDAVVACVEQAALTQGHTVRRMPSGAGHDAQMLARVCPTGMIFVPSVNGLSHNPAEYTSPADLEAGANVLLQVMLELAAT